MQHPEHLISNPKKGLTPERMAGLVFGGVIPAVFIWALMAGLIPRFTIPIEPPIDAPIIKKKVIVDQPPPGPVIDRHVDTQDIQPPPIPNDNSSDHTITLPPGAGGGNQWAGPGDTPVHGVMATHTIPPYPPLSIRLEEQGTVMLRLEISTDGSVTNATVEKSSGSSRLDQAAITWVIQNWRYQPATKNGVPVATTTEAAVKFDLRNAMR